MSDRQAAATPPNFRYRHTITPHRLAIIRLRELHPLSLRRAALVARLAGLGASL